MKKLFALIILITVLATNSFAKKDTNAWKNEIDPKEQYKIFKDNLNYWAGNYVVSSSQLDEFYGAMNDSISQLQSRLHESELEIIKQEDELAQRQNLVNDTQEKLDQSQKLQNSITVLGMNINKSVYSVSMYLFIVAVLALAGIIFMMYKRSHRTTRQTQKEYDELKLEYEEHKKTALDRYTRINMELHKTRLELQKK